MPSTRKRGGVTRIRTVRLKGGRYARVYVYRSAGPHGGHTELGHIKRRKKG